MKVKNFTKDCTFASLNSGDVFTNSIFAVYMKLESREEVVYNCVNLLNGVIFHFNETETVWLRPNAELNIGDV